MGEESSREFCSRSSVAKRILTRAGWHVSIVRAGVGALTVACLFSCQSVPIPIDEYALARAAIDSAKNAQAARFSPGLWHKAENSYRKAQALYRNQDWADAKEEFLKAREAAEKAENSARLIRQKTGEVL